MVVLWLGSSHERQGRPLAAVAELAFILLSHTRTALVGMVAALLVAGPEPDRNQGTGT